MHTGILTCRVVPEETEEAVLIYLGSAVPKMREQRGFRGDSCCRIPRLQGLHHHPPGDGRRRKSVREHRGTYQEQVARLGNLLAEPPNRELYEVSVQM